MASMFLTADEVRELTDRVQCSAQEKALRSMGIEHRRRPDGSLAVSRAHVEQIFCSGSTPKRKTKVTDPDWGALHATRS